MGIVVPIVILFFLETWTAGAWLTVAIPSFFGWCIAEFAANLLARPRLRNRTPGSAIREWKPAGDPEGLGPDGK